MSMARAAVTRRMSVCAVPLFTSNGHALLREARADLGSATLLPTSPLPQPSPNFAHLIAMRNHLGSVLIRRGSRMRRRKPSVRTTFFELISALIDVTNSDAEVLAAFDSLVARSAVRFVRSRAAVRLITASTRSPQPIEIEPFVPGVR